MNLDEARELRRELEAIDALMRGILEKAEQLPSVDQLDDLAQQVAFISGHLDNAVEQSRELAAGGLKGRHAEAGGGAGVAPIIVEAGLRP